MAKKRKTSPYSTSGQTEYAKRLRTQAWHAGNSFAKLKARLRQENQEKLNEEQNDQQEQQTGIAGPGAEWWKDTTTPTGGKPVA